VDSSEQNTHCAEPKNTESNQSNSKPKQQQKILLVLKTKKKKKYFFSSTTQNLNNISLPFPFRLFSSISRDLISLSLHLLLITTIYFYWFCC
jgi:hypothetical protein